LVVALAAMYCAEALGAVAAKDAKAMAATTRERMLKFMEILLLNSAPQSACAVS
jgi:hypothetical protein